MLPFLSFTSEPYRRFRQPLTDLLGKETHQGSPGLPIFRLWMNLKSSPEMVTFMLPPLMMNVTKKAVTFIRWFRSPNIHQDFVAAVPNAITTNSTRDFQIPIFEIVGDGVGMEVENLGDEVVSAPFIVHAND